MSQVEITQIGLQKSHLTETAVIASEFRKCWLRVTLASYGGGGHWKDATSISSYSNATQLCHVPRCAPFDLFHKSKRIESHICSVNLHKSKPTRR